METIQIVLEPDLLKAADRAARSMKVNRSAFIRQAIREHLKALRTREREEADRAGYERRPESASELAAWDGVAAWPEE